MQMHELIDREEPRCLYCSTECDVKQAGFPITYGSSVSYEFQVLTCRKCKEVFEIRWFDKNGEIQFLGFVFSCNKIVVYNGYGDGFAIGGANYLFKNWKGSPPNYEFIPAFLVDFSDKKKLYEKLKTYLVFS